MRSRWVLLVLLSFVSACAAPVQTEPAQPAGDAGPPRQLLEQLVIGERGSMDGYDREQYPHWSAHENNCNTRELVLKRDGKDVKAGSDCAPSSGSWTSPYDGETWTKASDVDIDHMVPLGHSWVSGARSWTKQRREEFANDMERPQLLTVTDNVNQQKSDKAPDEWKPPLVSYWCTYAGDWIEVKHHYGLTVTEREKTALSEMLNRC
ncbi:HNH endonuclease family protein [Amycolatopsis lurida]